MINKQIKYRIKDQSKLNQSDNTTQNINKEEAHKK
jgi:hypothetical protein